MKKSSVIFGGFLKIFVEIEIFNLTLQTKKLKILIFNCPLKKLFIKISQIKRSKSLKSEHKGTFLFFSPPKYLSLFLFSPQIFIISSNSNPK
jgi:hypothetical protein